MKDFFVLATAFLVMCFILYASYAFTKFLSKNAGATQASKYIKLQDRLPLGRDKYIAITQIGNQYFLIGVCEQSITNLGTLDTADLIEIYSNKENEGFAFQQLFCEKLSKKNTEGERAK